MEPIRILHENVIMDLGGIETQLMRIYRNIDRSKVQFDFLFTVPNKGLTTVKSGLWAGKYTTRSPSIRFGTHSISQA